MGSMKFRDMDEVGRIKAVQADARDLARMPEDLRTEAVCLAAVQTVGMALMAVPDVAKTEAVCMAAVEQDGEVKWLTWQDKKPRLF